MRILQEGRKEFLAWAGGDKELVDRFLANRTKYYETVRDENGEPVRDAKGNVKRTPMPEADMEWWIKNKTPQELKDFIDNFKSKTAKEKEEKVAGTEVVYNDDNWRVIHLKTYEAARHYGGDSTWCITGKWPNHEAQGQKYFNDYLKSNYTGYYLYVNKHFTDPRKDAKYMVCPKQSNPDKYCDIYDQEHNPSTIPFIPNCYVHVDGLPDVGQAIIKDGKLTEFKLSSGANDIEIPDGVVSIKHNLFMDIEDNYKRVFYSVKFPDSLKIIESGAFATIDIRELKLNDTIEKIGSGSFMDCSQLRSAVVGKGITSIPKYCFAYCPNLKEVEFRGTINSIEDNSFEGHKDLRFWCRPDNKLLIDYGNRNNITVVDVDTAEVLTD